MVIFHFGLFFPSYLPNSVKNQNLQKMKKMPGISSFCNSVSKIMIICYTIPEISCVMDVIIFHAIFCSFILTDQKIKIQKKKWKKQLEKNHHFTSVHQKLWSDVGKFLRYGAQQMDWHRQTNKWTDGKIDI